ncbi:MAG TPA: PAC2 family protein [Candidatus Limnocylindrales bacterium]
MVLYRLDDPGRLDAPVLVAAFDGWIDAGGASTTAADRIADDGRVVATFDADRLYDYRARRPTLDIIDGSLLDLDWPELHLRAARIGGRDLLVLSGPEPDYRWRQLASDVASLAADLGVVRWISMGAIPAAVAHTRPITILGTASAPGLLPPDVAQGPAGHLQVPSAALSVLELTASRTGLPAIGFYAQVPHYVSGPSAAAAIELLGRVGRHLDVEFPLGSLPSEAREQRALLDAAVDADERTRTYVARLEEMTDEERLPAGDDLIADIERFLRERGAGGRGQT